MVIESSRKNEIWPEIMKMKREAVTWRVLWLRSKAGATASGEALWYILKDRSKASGAEALWGIGQIAELGVRKIGLGQAFLGHNESVTLLILMQ